MMHRTIICTVSNIACSYDAVSLFATFGNQIYFLLLTFTIKKKKKKKKKKKPERIIFL
ncbi:hypothetical protein HanPI659440_Chr14g0560341 [Helianthus annuus]|nr:hypothetical protein HanPI659440_Chr14g0560341 [Helianthus annuus]